MSAWFLTVLLCGVLCLGAIVRPMLCHAADTKTDPLPVVNVDLNTGAFTDYLPFDTPFLIRGKATSDLRRVQVCHLLKNSDADVECDSVCTGWVAAKDWIRFDGFDGNEFNVQIAALEANRYYQFTFRFTRKMSGDEVTKFQGAAAAAIDKKLRGVSDVVDFQLEDLQGLLIDALPKSSAQKPTWPPGSLFDKSPEGSERLRTQLAGALDVLGPQSNRADAIGNLTSFQDPPVGFRRADLRLQTLSKSVLLQAVGRATRKTASQSGDRAKVVEEGDLCLLLSQFTPDELSRIADGRMALAGAQSTADVHEGDIRSIWKAAEADPQIANLRTTSQNLERIRTVVSRVEQDRAILTADSALAKATRTQLEQLRAEVIAAQDAINNVRMLYGDLREALRSRDEAITGLAATLALDASETVSVLGSSGGTFTARAKWYFSADLGLAYVPSFDDILSYYGINIYFRPVNKEVPLSRKGGPWRRTAVMLGVTFGSVASDGQRSGILGDKGIVYGIGYRLTDYIRLSVGGVLFYKSDPNPLISDEKLTTVPYAALSFDWDIKGTLGDLGTAISGK